MLASIHGVYDLTEALQEPYVVPANVIVIEVADMGEQTLTTIDPLLWELIQNRELFRSIISGDNVEKRFLPTLRALHLYMPGDLLYERKLIYEPKNIFDNGWALYRFGATTTGVPFPKNHGTKLLANQELNSPKFKKISDNFLQDIKDSLYRVERSEGSTLRSGLTMTSRNENYSQIQFIKDCQSKYGIEPTIYIISACADMWLSTTRPSAAEKAKDRIISINQRDVDLRNYECGITTLAFQGNSLGESVRLNPSVPVEQPSLRSRTGASKSTRVPGWTEDFARATYGNPIAVTQNTIGARKMLEAAEPIGNPVLGNLNGARVLLYTKDYKHIPNGISANWPRENAEKYAKGKELLTVGRDAQGKPIYLPFKTRCNNGLCCKIINGIMKCFKGGTRRFLKKSKKTRKVRKIKKFP